MLTPALPVIVVALFVVQPQSPAPIWMASPPQLPVITRNALPGEGWATGKSRLHGPAVVFDSWKPGRHRMTTVPAGNTVLLLAGLNVVHQPDIVVVTSPIPQLQLSAGDTLLRYAYEGEGVADFWAKGRWYRKLDGSFIKNADGSGCQSNCKARVVRTGVKTWWFHIRLPDGRSGWTDAFDSINPNWDERRLPTSAIGRMHGLFSTAKPAKAAQLLGTWVKVSEIWTERDLTGGTGPDHVYGRRRTNIPGSPVDWKVTFQKSAGHVEATSDTVWQPSGDSSDVKFESNGDFIFQKQTGGDSNYVFRCRMAAGDELVCLDIHVQGHGIEFRRVRNEPTKP